jgi:hypothetical protein
MEADDTSEILKAERRLQGRSQLVDGRNEYKTKRQIEREKRLKQSQ